MSFSNLEKAFEGARSASKDWYSKVALRPFETELNDFVSNHMWPTPKLETWKYTNIINISKIDFWPAEQAVPKVLPKVWQEFLDKQFLASFVFWNGLFIPGLSNNTSNQAFSFSQSMDKSKSLSSNSEIEILNQLLLSGLYSFEVKKNQKLRAPVVFLFLNSSDVDRPQIRSSRLQISLQEFAEVEVLEIHAGLTRISDQVASHQIEVSLSKESHLEHTFLNLSAAGTTNFFTKKYEQAGASKLKSLHIDLGGEMSRTETFVNLNESLAEAFVNGVYLNQAKQHTDHQGIIQHRAPETISHQTFKGILTDQSRAVFNSKIRIEKGASKSNAEQLNKNLIMSNKAEANSLPRLEIFNDDVKAKHGSASGQIDPEQLFYLESRAIPHDQAVQLLIEGNAFEMLEGINMCVYEKIRPFVSEKLSSFKREAK